MTDDELADRLAASTKRYMAARATREEHRRAGTGAADLLDDIAELRAARAEWGLTLAAVNLRLGLPVSIEPYGERTPCPK